MSYTASCLAVHRTARNQENLAQAGFATKHDRLGTVSGCWKLDQDRAAACAYLLVVTEGVIVDVARILGAEVVPQRWTALSEDDEARGLRPIDKNRVSVITAPTVPNRIETLIGQPLTMGRSPVRYVTIAVNGSAVIQSAEPVEDGDEPASFEQERSALYTGAAWEILIDVARTGSTITYGSLAERIMEATGVDDTRPLNWWIGDVLRLVARTNHLHGEPLLASLVVRASDGRVGEGYLGPVRDLLGEAVEDGEEHAALQRVRCYRHAAEGAYAADDV